MYQWQSLAFIYMALAHVQSFRDDCHYKTCKFTVFSSGPFCQIHRVSDEALIAETMVRPNFFLMNVCSKDLNLLLLFQLLCAHGVIHPRVFALAGDDVREYHNTATSRTRVNGMGSAVRDCMDSPSNRRDQCGVVFVWYIETRYENKNVCLLFCQPKTITKA